MMEPILLLDSNRGVYIPRDFAQQIYPNLLIEHSEISETDLFDLSDPNNEWYWDTWDGVLNNFLATIEGQEYSLCQDEDLWLVPIGFSLEDFED